MIYYEKVINFNLYENLQFFSLFFFLFDNKGQYYINNQLLSILMHYEIALSIALRNV